MIRIPEQWRGDGQGEPLEAVTAEGAAPVLAIVGTSDQWTPAEIAQLLPATVGQEPNPFIADLERRMADMARNEG